MVVVFLWGKLRVYIWINVYIKADPTKGLSLWDSVPIGGCPLVLRIMSEEVGGRETTEMHIYPWKGGLSAQESCLFCLPPQLSNTKTELLIQTSQDKRAGAG